MATKQTEEDIRNLSKAMDHIARLIIQNKQSDTQLQSQYESRLKEVNKLINMILRLSAPLYPSDDGLQLDQTKLDGLLNNGIEIIERDNNEKFMLLPVTNIVVGDASVGKEAKKKPKKKKNKIPCSYCNEIGHTRSKCPKKLLNPI